MLRPDDPLRRAASARSRRHLRLRPQPRLSRRGQRDAEASRAVRRRRASAPAVKVFVDTAPVMEKPLAQAGRARLAGQAHQPRLARATAPGCSWARSTPRSRSTPDPPHADRCGSCARCLDVCPTGGVPGALSARRYALHLLPHHRASRADPARAAPAARQPDLRLRRLPRGLPMEPLRPRNAARQAPRPRRPHAPRARRAGCFGRRRLPDAVRRIPVKRIGRNRFVRNVLIAIGNAGDPALRPAAARARDDPDPVVAEAASWAVARARGSSRLSGLVKRSFSLAGHRTSVALEPEFWAVLTDIAAARQIRLSASSRKPTPPGRPATPWHPRYGCWQFGKTRFRINHAASLFAISSLARALAGQERLRGTNMVNPLKAPGPTGADQPPISPLVISDRLISLAEQAGQVGCVATARHLIRLASRVLEEKSGFAPQARPSLG